MILKTKKAIAESEVTDQAVFQSRRQLLKNSLAAIVLSQTLNSDIVNAIESSVVPEPKLAPTPLNAILNYTNYYEFSYEKTAATQLAQQLAIDPWSVEITGAIAKPGIYHLEDLLSRYPQEERLYRFRCVEAWAMVVPWLGFPLASLIKQLQPTSHAKFVEFTSIVQSEAMPNTNKQSMLIWPYTEALRLDEALNPLTLMATGVFGEPLSKQNGAPLRLVVPWKYGFKSIKAIAKIHFSENQPISSWTHAAPNEYGFYANVNPNVAHPRWSQSTERVLGSEMFTARRKTELFNGYADQVAGLYSNLDLKRHF